MRILVLSTLVVLLAACSQPEISQERVERVLKTLASDDMRGRGAFTEDADRAAAFIASEFADIGLETLKNNEAYLQQFEVYSVATGDLGVLLNGVAVPNAAASLSANVSWSMGAGPEPTMVGVGSNLIEVLQSMRRSGDAFLVVHPSHAEAFGRASNFLARPSRSLELSGGSSLVMVLSDARIVTDYAVTGSAVVSELGLTNVVGILPGKRTDETVLFSAHYDHIGIRPGTAADADSIANGANDDASGTAAVIELARYFKAMPKQERSIVFAAFTAEESGGYGSRYFSSQMNPDQIVAMFNIEMIGKGAAAGPNTAWITGFDRSDFGSILQAAVQGTEFSFYADPYPSQNLFYRSDNATLARLGVPAHSLSTTPIDVDEDYHKVSDEVATLDIPHMTATIRAIAAGATTIVSGQATPTRIDPETVISVVRRSVWHLRVGLSRIRSPNSTSVRSGSGCESGIAARVPLPCGQFGGLGGIGIPYSTPAHRASAYVHLQAGAMSSRLLERTSPNKLPQLRRTTLARSSRSPTTRLLERLDT
ncbi:MAG: hypothetical protein ACI80V_001175 [Rhodothermales bacterium]|jgi:hypothetical protein